jgi:hypothetical protein
MIEELDAKVVFPNYDPTFSLKDEKAEQVATSS